MPRITHTAVPAPGTQDYDGSVLTQTAADTVNKEQTLWTGKELIIAENTGAGAHTVTINSVVDNLGRTKDINAVSLAVDELRIFGPFGNEGWRQTDGMIYFEASNVAVKFSVIKLP